MNKNDRVKNLIPLDFSVVGATSEDPDHTLYSIMSDDKNEGWCSVPFCKYPQEIIIQLNQPSNLSQINLTLHESKIPTKIDFYYFYPDDNKEKDKKLNKQLDFNNIPFLKLGYIIPNSNQKTNYKAREFQKIKINRNVLFVKFVLHKNYINLENKYNQVSLISIEFLGLELENTFNNNLFQSIKSSNSNNISSKPKYNDEDLDENCLSKLKEIKTTLDLCVQKEKYERAKIFRELYQRVRLLGEQIIILSEYKLKSIETNDFESCKKFQGEIDRIKKLINEINVNFPENNENENTEENSPFD